jgi:hypothetical protein
VGAGLSGDFAGGYGVVVVAVALAAAGVVVELGVAFNAHNQRPLVPKTKPGAAVGKRVGRRGGSGIERMAHAATDVA